MTHSWINKFFLDFVFSLYFLQRDSFALEPSFDVPVVNITARIGSTAILPCSVESLGDHKVVWTDQFSTLLTFDINRIIDDDRISIDRPLVKDWNLLIHDVRVTDRGRYICQINTKPIKTKPVQLNVLVPPQILLDEEITEKNIIAKEGDTVNMVCNVTGIPPPTVNWYRRRFQESLQSKERIQTTDLNVNHSLPKVPCIYTYHKTGIGESGEILVIHNVSRHCDGIYECVAFNDVPPAVKLEITVHVEFQPEVTLINKRLGQVKGKETILECSISAFPQALSYWKYHGTEVTKSDRHKLDVYPDTKQHSITLSLQIQNISDSDFGQYECFASNKIGKDRESMILYEFKPIEAIKTTTELKRTRWPTYTQRPRPGVRPIQTTPYPYIPKTKTEHRKPGRNFVAESHTDGNGSSELTQTIHILTILILTTFCIS